MIGNAQNFFVRIDSVLEKKYGRTDGVIRAGDTDWYPPKKIVFQKNKVITLTA